MSVKGKKFSNRERSNSLESQSKADFVAQLLVDGYSRREIQSICLDKWNCVERTVDTYISQAKELIKASQPESKTFYKNLVLERLEAIYLRSMESGKYQISLNAMAEICKMFGLYEQDAVNEKLIQINYKLSEPKKD